MNLEELILLECDEEAPICRLDLIKKIQKRTRLNPSAIHCVADQMQKRGLIRDFGSGFVRVPVAIQKEIIATDIY